MGCLRLRVWCRHELHLQFEHAKVGTIIKKLLDRQFPEMVPFLVPQTTNGRTTERVSKEPPHTRNHGLVVPLGCRADT